jgi:hypothetical protein
VTGLEAALPSMHTLLTLGRRAVLVATAVTVVYLLWRFGWPRQQPTRRAELWAQRGLVVALTAVVAVEAVSVGTTGETAVANWGTLTNLVTGPLEIIWAGLASTLEFLYQGIMAVIP